VFKPPQADITQQGKHKLKPRPSWVRNVIK
jgi:hypothetical protein